MKTTKSGALTLAGIALSALAVSAPVLARDFDGYSRRAAYERDYRADYGRRHYSERHRFDRRHRVMVERPVYVDRPVIVERPYYVEQPAPANNNPASLGATIGGMIGAILGDRATDGR